MCVPQAIHTLGMKVSQRGYTNEAASSVSVLIELFIEPLCSETQIAYKELKQYPGWSSWGGKCQQPGNFFMGILSIRSKDPLSLALLYCLIQEMSNRQRLVLLNVGQQ